MLADQPIDVMLLATDLAVAREFYGEKVGLEVLLETDDFLTFKAGGDSRLVVTKSTTGTRRRGGSTTSPRRSPSCAPGESNGLKTVDGVADVGFALSAWFVDPSGNNIGLLEFKGEGPG